MALDFSVMICIDMYLRNLPSLFLLQTMNIANFLLARQKIIKRENFSEEKWKKIYYLSNGNGSEMRWLAAFI